MSRSSCGGFSKAPGPVTPAHLGSLDPIQQVLLVVDFPLVKCSGGTYARNSISNPHHTGKAWVQEGVRPFFIPMADTEFPPNWLALITSVVKATRHSERETHCYFQEHF
jgi:hypothetical protein